MGRHLVTKTLQVVTGSILRDEEESQRFAGFRVRYSSGGALEHSRQGGDFFLDLGEAYPDASHFEEATHASFDPEVAFGVEAPQIAGREPAIFENALRLFGIVQVTGTDRGPLDPNLTHCSWRHIPSLFVNDPDREI